MAESRRLETFHQSGTSKHRAGSPLESPAKRGRHDVVTSQALELVPQPDGSHEDWDLMGSSLAGIPSAEGVQWNLPKLDLQMSSNFVNEERCWTLSHMWSPIGVAGLDQAFTDNGDRYYVEQGSMNPGMGSPYPSSSMALVAPVPPYTETPVYELVLSRPAEFLAIRETEGRHDC